MTSYLKRVFLQYHQLVAFPLSSPKKKQDNLSASLYIMIAKIETKPRFDYIECSPDQLGEVIELPFGKKSPRIASSRRPCLRSWRLTAGKYC